MVGFVDDDGVPFIRRETIKALDKRLYGSRNDFFVP